MIRQPEDAGWSWFDMAAAWHEPDQEELCRAIARCFAGPDGERVTEHLKRLILDRRLLPSASDAELRHVEGQRFAVAYIMSMVARGRD
jgi:hypothetical protein